MRGSDPDAALYWLARMVYAGEDPRFLFRRLVVLASEDVGLADSNAVAVVTACAQAFDRVGMPEGRYPLAQATLYLATAPKSNTTMGFFDALAAVEREQTEVPPHLQDANRDAAMGHGQNYLYPHAYRDHWVAQQYLPDNLQDQVFYQPSSQGDEGRLAAQVQRRREAQLAAVTNEAISEILTLSPEDAATDRWIQRSLSQTSAHLAQVRDRLFDHLQPQRHHVLLCVNALGLLVWEAVRRVPEGGVYAAVTEAERTALEEQAQLLPELRQPMILPILVRIADKHPNIAFDGIVGRNLLLGAADKAVTAAALASVTGPDTTILLAESLPKDSQRISQLLALPAGVGDHLTEAENALYDSDPNLAWGQSDLIQLFEAAPLSAQVEVERMTVEVYLSPRLVNRWVEPGQEQPSYRDRLAPLLSPQDLEAVCRGLRSLIHQTVNWETQVAFVRLTATSHRQHRQRGDG